MEVKDGKHGNDVQERTDKTETKYRLHGKQERTQKQRTDRQENTEVKDGQHGHTMHRLHGSKNPWNQRTDRKRVTL